MVSLLERVHWCIWRPSFDVGADDNVQLEENRNAVHLLFRVMPLTTYFICIAFMVSIALTLSGVAIAIEGGFAAIFVSVISTIALFLAFSTTSTSFDLAERLIEHRYRFALVTYCVKRRSYTPSSIITLRARSDHDTPTFFTIELQDDFGCVRVLNFHLSTDVTFAKKLAEEIATVLELSFVFKP